MKSEKVKPGCSVERLCLKKGGFVDDNGEEEEYFNILFNNL
jgi:hypothetical protein